MWVLYGGILKTKREAREKLAINHKVLRTEFELPEGKVRRDADWRRGFYSKANMLWWTKSVKGEGWTIEGSKDWYPLTQESHRERKSWWWWSWITTAGMIKIGSYDYEELWARPRNERLSHLVYAIMLAKTFNLYYVDKMGAVWGYVGIMWAYLNEIYPLCSVSWFLASIGD